MAVLEIILPMITVGSAALSLLGIIKRRCGASQEIKGLVNRCAKLVCKIQELLKTLEGYSNIPPDFRLISTSLRHRREEMHEILMSLDEMQRLTERTGLYGRTEKFIMAQGWAKKMDAVHTDLHQVRNGIENIVSNWDLAIFIVTSVVKIPLAQYLERAERLTNRNELAEGVDIKGAITFSSTNPETEPSPLDNLLEHESLESKLDSRFTKYAFSDNARSHMRVLLLAIMVVQPVHAPLATSGMRTVEEEAPTIARCWCSRLVHILKGKLK